MGGSDFSEKKLSFVQGNIKKALQAGAHGFRSLGSCALNICTVACGRGDVFYEAGMHIWDICAAGVILREAGGATTDLNGGKLDLCGRKILAGSSAEICQEAAKVLDIFELERD